jgi:hypothetical protein
MSQTGDLNANYKIAYAGGIEDLVPKISKLGEMINFVPSELQNGKHYQQPVVVTQEAGFTASLDTQTAYTLNSAIGMEMQEAVVPGVDIVLSSVVGYNQAARALSGKNSFKSVMSLKFENMLQSTEKRAEILRFYGQTPIATAALQTVTIASSMLPVVIDVASWASGMWAGSENQNVVFVVASDNTAVDSLRSFRIAKVDDEAHTLYVAAGTEGTAGTLTTLETAIEAAALNMHFYGFVSGSAGSFAYVEMAGLKKQMTNTGSLFGIDAATYDLWRGNSVAVTGQLTMAKVLSAVSRAVSRGLDSDAAVFVNPKTWADLASNLAALRRFDGSYSKAKASNGSEVLEYIGQNGTLKIIPYSIVKQGDCFIFPVDKVIRVGAYELSLQDPTRRGSEEIFFTLPTAAGSGIRAYMNESIFLETPAQAVYISGIVNSL